MHSDSGRIRDGILKMGKICMYIVCNINTGGFWPRTGWTSAAKRVRFSAGAHHGRVDAGDKMLIESELHDVIS